MKRLLGQAMKRSGNTRSPSQVTEVRKEAIDARTSLGSDAASGLATAVRQTHPRLQEDTKDGLITGGLDDPKDGFITRSFNSFQGWILGAGPNRNIEETVNHL